MSASKTPTDFVGKEITIGVEVIYPRRQGSTMWLCRGRVKDIHFNTTGDPWTLDVIVATTDGNRLGRGVPATRCVVA